MIRQLELDGQSVAADMEGTSRNIVDNIMPEQLVTLLGRKLVQARESGAGQSSLTLNNSF